MSGLIDELRERRLPPPADARAIRLAAGVSQERLAAELGVHRVTVYRWEFGQRLPRGPQREAYAKLLSALRRVARRPTGGHANRRFARAAEADPTLTGAADVAPVQPRQGS